MTTPRPFQLLAVAIACLIQMPATHAADTQVLFDGTSTDAFRNYKSEGIDPKWQIIDGALTLTASGGGDLITKEKYENFVLELEFKIAPAGNSGVMFRVTEDNMYPWQSGPEVQIQDNVDGHDPQRCGWLYQLYAADTDATKPAGEWNSLKIIISEDGCKHYLNDVLYVEYEIDSDDWDQQVAKSKFAGFKGFGETPRGHICLQDHGDEVAYRNIRITPLD